MRIFLIRHGESLGNIDESAYRRLQDHNVPLTDWGKFQAEEAGKFLRQYYKDHPEYGVFPENDLVETKKIRVWYSPFLRTVQTKDHMIKTLGADIVSEAWEDYLLREQDFGVFSHIFDPKEQKRKFPVQFNKYAAAVKASGKFYARFPDGESRADVAQRVRLFEGTLMRDVMRGQEDVIIVAHGVTNRAIEMDFLHKGVEWFEKEPNPGNCDIVLIEGDRENGYSAKRIYQGVPNPAPVAVAKPRKTFWQKLGLGGKK